MKVALFLFLIISPVLAFSQEYPDNNSYCNLVPYYDYALCAKGLKDTSGNVLLEPRYSEITLIPNDFILVCENEQYGVIDCNLNTVIPSKYKKLQWFSKYSYQSRSEQYYWLLETEEGIGLMNSSAEVIFGPENDGIERVILETQPSAPGYTIHSGGRITLATASLFRVIKDGKPRIYNEFGELIIADDYNEIKCYGVDKPSSTPKLPNGIFFLAKNDSNQVVLSENGKQLFSESLDAELYVFSVDSSTIIRVTRQDQTSQAICLETGDSTERNKCRISKDNFFMFAEMLDGSFNLYGKNLQHLYFNENRKQGLQLLSIQDDLYLKLTTANKQNTLFSRKGEVLIQTKDFVYTTNSETGGCIWSVPENLDEQEDTLRLYLPNGELKKEYVLNGISPNHFFVKNWHHNDDDAFEELVFIKQGSKWGALDRNGDLKIPFQFDTCGVPFGSMIFRLGTLHDDVLFGYFITKKGKMGSIDRSGNKLLACKYDTTFSVEIDFADHTYFYPRKRTRYGEDKRTYSSFAIRKNQLVSLIDGKEQVCDSTLLPFDGPLMLVGHALINYDGKVVREIKDGTIHKTKKFFFHIQGEEAQVIRMNGEAGLKIDRFKSAQVEGDYLKVKLTNETLGVISLDGRRWLYQPKYYDITFTKLTPEHAWVKEDTLQTYYSHTLKLLESYDGRWMLVDTSYNQLYDFPFRSPVNLVYRPRAVFESEGRLGLIDTSLNVVFLPEYELIYPIRYSEYSLLYKDSLWQLGHSSGALLPQRFNSISYQEINQTMAVFSFNESDTLIGFVKFEDGYNWVVPMTEMHDLIANSSLRMAMGTESNAQFMKYGIRPEQDSLDLWRVQNNELIVYAALQNQCHIRGLPIEFPQFLPDFEFYNAQTHVPSKQFYDEVNPRTFTNNNYIKSEFTYPPELKETQKVDLYPKCSWPTFHNGEMLTVGSYLNCAFTSYGITYENYVYSDSVQLIELSDILQQNKETSAFLRAFIVQELTEVQSGVEVCPDLDKSEEFMWSSFYFFTGGIQFPDLKLFLPYSEFETFLTDLGKGMKPW